MTAASDWILPPLREDLRLQDGGADESGNATFLVHDPLRNRHFRLDGLALQVLRLWRAGASIGELADRVQASGLGIDAEEVAQVVQFLEDNDLTEARGEAGTERLASKRAAGRSGWGRWLMHNYLFIRIPLVHPDAFLERWLPRIRFLFSRWLHRLIVGLGIIGILLVIQQWAAFKATFLHFFTWQGLGFYLVTLLFVKSLHELGHAFTAKRHGVHVSSMGVAFLVLFPVFYTDTTDAWRLTERRDRLAITLAGVTTEILLALLATFLWSFLPDGILRSAAFFVATTSWVTSLAVNASPFLRFDGYYALMDLLRADNLQPRSFALGRWRLRELLFGLGEPAPESLPHRRQRTFVLYAWATWIYRFFLFLGIALLIYHKVFKVLGLFLAAVELYWFILRPILGELRQWWGRRQSMRWNRSTVVTATLLAGGLLALLLPWRPNVALPAVMQADRYAEVYAPEGAQVAAVTVEAGDRVEAGQVLVRLTSAKLVHRREKLDREIAMLALQLDRLAGSEQRRARRFVLEDRLGQKRTALAGVNRRRDRLTLTAPVAGRVTFSRELRQGQWVGAEEPLLAIAGAGEPRVTAFVGEQDLHRIREGAAGRFIPRDGLSAAVPLEVTAVDGSAIERVRYPSLSSRNQGPLAVRPADKGGSGQTGGEGEEGGKPEQGGRPENALYRVTLRPADGAEASVPYWRLPGYAHVEAPPVSLLERGFRKAASVLIRESGF